MAQIIIALGSNIEPQKNITLALELIREQFTLLASSQFVETEPIGNKHQSHFLNGAVLISSTIDRATLKKQLKHIETLLGRDLTQDKMAPRTIDLDIIVWDETIVDSDVYERDFLKDAILELRPELDAKLQTTGCL